MASALRLAVVGLGYEHFVECARTRAEPRTPGADAVRTQAFMGRLLQAMGRPLEGPAWRLSRAWRRGTTGSLPMDAGPSRPTRAALALLAGYQRWLSPLLPGACRFWPTCSEYARLALLRHGLVRGGGLALWRLCRCHRFARGGVDPPP